MSSEEMLMVYTVINMGSINSRHVKNKPVSEKEPREERSGRVKKNKLRWATNLIQTMHKSQKVTNVPVKRTSRKESTDQGPKIDPGIHEKLNINIM
jgi:hypothetical protein